jgi:hypothetical protein
VREYYQGILPIGAVVGDVQSPTDPTGHVTNIPDMCWLSASTAPVHHELQCKAWKPASTAT